MRPRMMRLPMSLVAALGLILTGIAALPGQARAAIELNIDSGVVQPLPISVPAFSGSPHSAVSALRSLAPWPVSVWTVAEQNWPLQ